MPTKKLPNADSWNSFWHMNNVPAGKPSWSKRRIMNVLDRYLQKAETALDAGCGSGFFSKYFCDKGLRTWSLDYSDDALLLAKKVTAGKAHIVKKDLLSASMSEHIKERFDIIFSDGLLEHFTHEQRLRIISNFRALLSERGLIITFVPNKWSPWQLIRPFYMPGIEEAPMVLSELFRLHERNGLKVVDSGGVNTFPFAFSPDRFVGRVFGMLIYTVAKRR